MYINKGLEAAVALYGIMKASAAYVPLEPFAPLPRLRQIIADCEIRCLVTQENKLVRGLQAGSRLECIIGVHPRADWPVLCIPWQAVLNAAAGTEPGHQVGEEDLAYILYTSGSTGTPKGIMHTHRSALSFAEWAAAEYGLSAADRVSNHAPLHFDLSTFDFFAAVLTGATTVIIPEYLSKFPAALSQLMAAEKISVWYSVPFALIQLLERGNLPGHDLSALRWVLFAGEPFPTKHLRQVMAALPQARFSNLYGPTETNVCTYYHVEPLPADAHEPMPIGWPCPDAEMLVVDESDRAVAAGETGELLVRSTTVMQGYWRRPDLNERAFFCCGGVDQMEKVFYRTGDLVQLRPDGHYKYLGRKDRQIKTRGYRVELDEIENALLTHEDVQEAAIYTILDSDGTNLIEGAVIPRQGVTLNALRLRKHLATMLPAYALPVRIIITDDFPRTSTGKVNRRELQGLALANAI